MTSIWWIRDDLRLHDNPALHAAATNGEVLAVHIGEEISGVRPLGGAARWWLHHSLSALAGALREHGVPRGKNLTLHVASADAELPRAPGQTGSAYRAEGTRVGPVNHGRRSVQGGAFAITRG